MREISEKMLLTSNQSVGKGRQQRTRSAIQSTDLDWEVALERVT